MIQGAAQYYRFAQDMGYVDFKTIVKVAGVEQKVNTKLGPDNLPLSADQ